MEKLFLDTNIFIDLIEKRDLSLGRELFQYPLFISIVSIMVLTYVYKYRIPNEKLQDFLENFNVIFGSELIVEKSLIGPTSDFEDNLQLHSAAEFDCDLFLTRDLQILKLGYFGKLKISEKIE